MPKANINQVCQSSCKIFQQKSKTKSSKITLTISFKKEPSKENLLTVPQNWFRNTFRFLKLKIQNSVKSNSNTWRPPSHSLNRSDVSLKIRSLRSIKKLRRKKSSFPTEMTVKPLMISLTTKFNNSSKTMERKKKKKLSQKKMKMKVP